MSGGLRPPGVRGAHRAVALLCAAAVLAAVPAVADEHGDRTERVSATSDGEPADRWVSNITVSGDGRYAAFASTATNLVPGVENNTTDVYLHERATGATERMSLTADGEEARFASYGPSLSGDGRYVAFVSQDRNLTDESLEASANVFVLDRASGALEALTGKEPEKRPGVQYWRPRISADGRYVAYYQNIPNPPGECCTERQVFWHDRTTGERRMVSVADGTPANNLAHFSDLSADGQHVAFMSSASNLSDVSGIEDIFVHDLAAGRTELVSVARDGGPHNGVFADQPSISGDGRYVAFTSDATNLVPRTSPGIWDVFVHDRQTGSTERVSVASDGREGDDFSSSPAISGDGRFVTFVSHATNLVEGDDNDVNDVFVHDRLTGLTEMVSVTPEGRPANHASYTPAVDHTGQHVAFGSRATDLVGDGSPAEDQAYLRDRGPAEGLEGMQLVRAGDQVHVTARASFVGAVLTAGSRGSSSGAVELGGDLVAASVTYRYRPGELLVRWQVSDIPQVLWSVPVPGVQYRLEFTHDDVGYRVSGTAPDLFLLERCDPACAPERLLDGTVGTVGDEARAVVPLDALDAGEGSVLADMRATSGPTFGSSREPVVGIDLGDAAIPGRTVDLWVAPAETPDQVVYDTTVTLDDDTFTATLAAPDDPRPHLVWTRACLGETCGTPVSRPVPMP